MKITSILFLLGAFWGANAQSPDSWTRKTDYGGHEVWSTIAFSIDSFGYLGCFGIYRQDTFPYGDIYPNEFWQYSARNDSWTQKSSFPGPHRAGGICFVIGGKAYIGLADGPFEMKDFWEYDPVVDTWTRKGDFPGGGRISCFSFSIGGKGYVGTGGTDTARFKKDVWEYDPVNDSWLKKGDFPGGGRENTIGFAVNGAGYVGLGFAPNSNFQTDLWQYLPTSDSWVRKTDFPSIRALGPTCLVIGMSGYFCTGGDSSTQTYNDVWRYNTQTDVWMQKDTFTGSPRFYAAGFSIGSKGYLGTGFKGMSRTYYKDFWEYTPDSLFTTGISDADISPVTLSPNPSSTRLYLSSPIPDITITDITGRVCSVTHTDREIDISSLPEGVYYVKLHTRDGSVVRRFVKE
jgi:N-acetylneuraminic acid mutarotase